MEKYWLAVGFQDKFIIQFDLVLNRATVQHRSFFAMGRNISQCIMGVALMHWIINSPTSLLGLFSFRSFVVKLEKNDLGTPFLIGNPENAENHNILKASSVTIC